MSGWEWDEARAEQHRRDAVTAGFAPPSRSELVASIRRMRRVWRRIERAYQEAHGYPRGIPVRIGALTRWWRELPRWRRWWLKARWWWWDHR